MLSITPARWVFPVSIRAILAGQDFAAFNPGQDGSAAAEQPVAQLAADYFYLRAETWRCWTE